MKRDGILRALEQGRDFYIFVEANPKRPLRGSKGWYTNTEGVSRFMSNVEDDDVYHIIHLVHYGSRTRPVSSED